MQLRNDRHDPLETPSAITVSIRPGAGEDRNALALLERRGIPLHETPLHPDPYLRQPLRYCVDDDVSAPLDGVWIAVVNGVPVGMIRLSMPQDDPAATVSRIRVAPAMKRTTLGQALLNFAIVQTSKAGRSHLRLGEDVQREQAERALDDLSARLLENPFELLWDEEPDGAAPPGPDGPLPRADLRLGARFPRTR